LGLTLGHLLRVVAEGVECGRQSLHGGQGVIGVTLLGDELASDFSSAQPGIQACRTNKEPAGAAFEGPSCFYEQSLEGISKDPRRKRRGFRKEAVCYVGGICPPNPLTRMPFLPTASSGASWYDFVKPTVLDRHTS
jgi:hypothetical protein